MSLKFISAVFLSQQKRRSLKLKQIKPVFSFSQRHSQKQTGTAFLPRQSYSRDRAKSLKQRQALKLKTFIWLALFFQPLAKAGPCERAFKQSQLNSPEAFALAMTRNLELAKSHESLFEFYRKGWFSHPQTYIGHMTLKNVFDFLEKNPDLSKPLIRERIISFTFQEMRKPDSLIKFLSQFKNSGAKIRRNLYQISANLGFWLKLLSDNPAKPNARESFLPGSFIGAETIEFVEDPLNSYKEKAIVLYQALNKIRKDWPRGQQKSARRLSQIMADLIHTAGLGNSSYNELLRSKNPTRNIEGILKILAEREFLSTEMGFENFNDLHFTLTGKLPENLKAKIETIKKDIENQTDIQSKTEVFRLRSLSIQEAPFRSCLSQDCASQIYFNKALDPNFLYFTLTDMRNKSSGYIVAVLGHAKNSKGKMEKIGFVDKIQNIPTEKLLAVLEGVRQSLEELGYKLGLPKKLGDHNGLSNISFIRNHVEREILPYLKTEFKSFKPASGKGLFANPGFSRAEENLDLLEFDPASIAPQNAKIKKGRLWPPQKADPLLSVKSLYEQSLLRGASDSAKEESQIQFLNQLLAAEKSEDLDLSKKYVRETLLSKMQNGKLSFKVRKLALWTLIQFEIEKKSDPSLSDLEGWLALFSEKEAQLIIGEISNWKKSNADFKKTFIENISQILFSSDINKLKTLFKSKYKIILDIEAENDFGFSALEKSAQNDWASIAALLIKNGANPNKIKRAFGLTPLMIAIKNKQMNSAKALVEAGADINAINGMGWTALMISVSHEDTEQIAWLIKEGADPRIKNNMGNTALMLAAKMGDISSMKLLIGGGANLYEENKEQRTALMLMTLSDQIEAMDWLIEQMSGPHVKKQQIQKALKFTAKNTAEGKSTAWLNKKMAELKSARPFVFDPVFPRF